MFLLFLTYFTAAFTVTIWCLDHNVVLNLTCDKLDLKY